MRNRMLILLLCCMLPLLQSCYVQRYYRIKKQYEEFDKALSKVKRTNLQEKSRNRSLNDSIALYHSRITKKVDETKRADSMIEVLSLRIREKLGPDPWSDSSKYKALHAAEAAYTTDAEEQVVYWLNLARQHPDLYAEMYLDPYLGLYKDSDWQSNGYTTSYMNGQMKYENSCYLEMAEMKPKNLLVPNEVLFKSAECHAIESGKTGYVGHQRFGCQQHFSGECCYYGSSDGYYVILGLLIDSGVPSLGHRHICLGGYDEIGASVQPHKDYGFNVVLDFY